MTSTEEIERIVALIHPLLAGQPAAVQGFVLADLLATWLVGHVIPEDAPATDLLRERLIKIHIKTVRKIVPLNAARLWAESERR